MLVVERATQSQPTYADSVGFSRQETEVPCLCPLLHRKSTLRPLLIENQLAICQLSLLWIGIATTFLSQLSIKRVLLFGFGNDSLIVFVYHAVVGSDVTQALISVECLKEDQ